MTTITVGTDSIYVPSWTTSTNLGPLPTTAFPLNCLENLWDFNTYGLGLPWTYMTQGCAAKTCCPSGNFYTEPWAWMTSYYSPGVCPSQYRSCDGPQPPLALSSAQGETIAFCCPTNYNCLSSGVFPCGSQLSTPTSVTVVDNIFDQSTLSTSSWTLEPELIYSWQIAYPIQVRTMASDTISISTGTETGTLTTGSVATSPPTASSTQPISTGDIIGIVSAILAFVTIIITLFTKRARDWILYDLPNFFCFNLARPDQSRTGADANSNFT